MTERERDRIQYDIESLQKALNAERKQRNFLDRNGFANPEERAYVEQTVSQLNRDIASLRRRLKTRRG